MNSPMDDNKNKSKDSLSSEMSKKKILDFCQKAMIDLYVEFRAQGNSSEEIQKLLKKEGLKNSAFEPLMGEFKKIEQLGQGLIIARKKQLEEKNIYDEYISYNQEDLRRLDQMLLSIDEKNPGSNYSNLTEKETAYLKLEIMKTKSMKIQTLFKPQHVKQEKENVR